MSEQEGATADIAKINYDHVPKKPTRNWEGAKQIKKWFSERVAMRKDKFTIFVKSDASPERELDGWDMLRTFDPVLIMNRHGQYIFVSAERAEELDREKKVVVLQPTDQDWVRAVYLARGLDPDKVLANTEKGSFMIQRFGKAVSPKDIGRTDPAADIEAELAMSAKYKNGAKPDGMPEASRFDKRLRESTVEQTRRGPGRPRKSAEL